MHKTVQNLIAIENQLGFKYVKKEEIYIDTTEKMSARSYATLVINKKLSP